MLKPRIFIHMHYLEIGGAESALIGLLHSLDSDKVDVDLFLNEHRGEMMKYIPDWINLLPPMKQYSVLEQPLIRTVCKLQLGVALGRVLSRFQFSKYQKKNKPKDDFAIFGYIGKYVNRFLPSLKSFGTYDLAISFLTPHNIVMEKVSAKKKICWIHTDYSSVDVNTELELPVWNSYDKIISISDSVTDSFYKKFPKLKDKIINIENILPEKVILNKAEEFLPPEMVKKDLQEISLLSIGRYCDAKNFDLVPYLCQYLINRGLRIKWYLIGYGADYELEKILKEINQYKVSDEVVLLGKKENPYPYIKACDWYVQPSRYEGKSITVKEAQLLGKPVIIRNYPTASSQVTNGVNGLIAAFNKDFFAENLFEYLTDKKLKEKITLNLKNKDLTFSEEVKKLYSLL